jgi:hypothetical protein
VGLSLAPLLLVPWLALGCGARSGVECLGDTCAALEGIGGAGGVTASAGRGGSGGTGGASNPPPLASQGGRNSEIPVPDDTPIVRPGRDPIEPVPGSPACANGGTFNGSVFVSDKAELERYEGCREIEGDLTIRGTDFDDLRPLASLRRVGGALILNTLGTLRGLGALESVDSLVIEQFGGDTLAPLGRLARIRAQLSISGAAQISTLRGLGALESVARIELLGNPALQSLSGLKVPTSLEAFRAIDVPQLTDLTALAPLQVIGTLEVQNTAVTDLSGLQNLREASSLALVDDVALASLSQLVSLDTVRVLFLENLGLVNANGLEHLRVLEDVIIQSNRNLVDVDALGSVQDLVELSVISNPALARLPQFPNVQLLQKLHIRDNSLLATGPAFPSATSAEFVIVAENPSLTQLNGFPSLLTARSIDITDNAALGSVAFSQLTSARTVRILCNAALDEASLEPLRSVASQAIISGNLGSPTACTSEVE